MDEEERNKKLRAGKEKLAAFQKKKSKKKHSHHHHGDETVATGDSSISSIDQSSSSDVPLFEDSDQNMTSEDESTIQDSKSLFKVQTKLKHATERIAELEESLEGKQLALDRVISENTKLKESDLSQKIAEMEVAMSKRDEIIRQLTTRLQSTASLQTEAEQLTHHVQQLQAQLINAGKLMESQNSKQLMSSQALLEAKHEIEALQKCIEDKDTLLSQLSDKVGAISDEYVNLKASYEASRQKEAESSKVVKSLMSDAEDIRRQGSVNGSVAVSNSYSDNEDRVQKVRLELEETYGNQIALMKDELSKLYNVEVEKLTGELNNFKEICAKQESDDNSLEEEKQKSTARNTSNDLLITELQSKLTEINSKCVQIQSEKDELTKENLTLSKQIDLLSSKLESIHHDHPESNGNEPVQEENNLESYNKITELNERNLNLTSELDTIRKDYANAQKNVEELEKRVKGSRPARFQVDSQEIVMELKQVTEQYEEALVNIALMQGRIEDYDIKCEILNEDLNKMKEQLKRSEDAAKTYEEQTKEYENIKEKLGKSEQEIKSFKESVKEYESKNEKVLSELRDMTEQYTNAQRQCEEYRDKFVEYEQQLTDYEGLTTQYNELQHECNVYQTQNDELNNKMNIQQDVVMELKAELEILSNQNQTFREQSPIQTQQLDDLTKENKSLLESIDLYKDEVTKLTNSLNQATVEVDTYKEKTNSLESLVKTLEVELKSKRDTELILKQKDDSIKKLTNDIDDLTLQLHMQEPVEESFQKETITHEEASLSLSNSVFNQVVALNETKDIENAQIVRSEANSALSFDCFVQEEIEQQSELAFHVASDMEADSLDGDTVDSIEDSKQSDVTAEIGKLQHENTYLHDENHELKLTIQNIKVSYGNDLEQALQSCRSEIVNLSAEKSKIETSYAVLEENIIKINEKVRLAESALATVEEEKLALQNELIYINSMVDDMTRNDGLPQSDSNTSLTVCDKLKTLQEKLEIAQSNTENLSSQSEKLKTEKLENIEIHNNILLHKQEDNDNLCKEVECLQSQMKNMETEVEKSKQLLKENESLSKSLQEMNEREQNLRIQCERLSQQIFELSVINQTVSGDKENLENRFVEVSAMENNEISDSVMDSHVNEVMSSIKSHDLLLTNQQLLPISENDNDVKCAVTADGETLVRDDEPQKTTDLLVHEGEITQQSTANQLTTVRSTCMPTSHGQVMNVCSSVCVNSVYQLPQNSVHDLVASNFNFQMIASQNDGKYCKQAENLDHSECDNPQNLTSVTESFDQTLYQSCENTNNLSKNHDSNCNHDSNSSSKNDDNFQDADASSNEYTDLGENENENNEQSEHLRNENTILKVKLEDTQNDMSAILNDRVELVGSMENFSDKINCLREHNKRLQQELKRKVEENKVLLLKVEENNESSEIRCRLEDKIIELVSENQKLKSEYGESRKRLKDEHESLKSALNSWQEASNSSQQLKEEFTGMFNEMERLSEQKQDMESSLQAVQEAFVTSQSLNDELQRQALENCKNLKEMEKWKIHAEDLKGQLRESEEKLETKTHKWKIYVGEIENKQKEKLNDLEYEVEKRATEVTELRNINGELENKYQQLHEDNEQLQEKCKACQTEISQLYLVNTELVHERDTTLIQWAHLRPELNKLTEKCTMQEGLILVLKTEQLQLISDIKLKQEKHHSTEIIMAKEKGELLQKYLTLEKQNKNLLEKCKENENQLSEMTTACLDYEKKLKDQLETYDVYQGKMSEREDKCSYYKQQSNELQQKCCIFEEEMSKIKGACRNLEIQLQENSEKKMSCESKLIELKDKYDHLEESNVEMKTDLKQMRDEICKLENEKEELQGQCSDYENQLLKTKECCFNLEKQVEEMTVKSVTFEKQKEEMTVQQNDSIKALDKERESLQSENKLLKEKCDRLSQEVENLNISLKTKFQEYESSVGELEKKNMKLKEDCEKSGIDVINLNKTHSDILKQKEKQIEELEQKVVTCSLQINELHDRCTQTDNALKHAEFKYSDLKQIKEKTETEELSVLSLQNHELSTKLESLENRIKDKELDYEELSQKCRELEKSFFVVQTENKELLQNCKHIELKKKAMQAKYSQLVQTSNETEEKLQKAISNLSSMNNDLNEKCGTHVTHIQNLNIDIEKIDQVKATVEQKLKEISERNRDVECSLKEVQDENRVLSKKIETNNCYSDQVCCELENLKQIHKNCEDCIVKLKTENKSLTHQLTEETKQLETLQQSHKEFMEELEQTQKSLLKLQEDHFELNNKKEMLEKENDQMKQQRERLSQEINNLSDELACVEQERNSYFASKELKKQIMKNSKEPSVTTHSKESKDAHYVHVQDNHEAVDSHLTERAVHVNDAKEIKESNKNDDDDDDKKEAEEDDELISEEELEILIQQRIDHEKKQIEYDLEEKYEIQFRKRQVELMHTFEKKQKELQKDFEQHVNHRVESLRAEKDQSFVKALQKVKKDFDKKLKKEMEKQRLAHLQELATMEDERKGGGHISGVVKNLLQENQELAEARDALLQQVELSHHQQDKLEDELRSMMGENIEGEGEFLQEPVKLNTEQPRQSYRSQSLLLDWEFSPSTSFEQDKDPPGLSGQFENDCQNLQCLMLRRKYQELRNTVQLSGFQPEINIAEDFHSAGPGFKPEIVDYLHNESETDLSTPTTELEASFVKEALRKAAESFSEVNQSTSCSTPTVDAFIENVGSKDDIFKSSKFKSESVTTTEEFLPIRVRSLSLNLPQDTDLMDNDNISEVDKKESSCMRHVRHHSLDRFIGQNLETEGKFVAEFFHDQTPLSQLNKSQDRISQSSDGKLKVNCVSKRNSWNSSRSSQTSLSQGDLQLSIDHVTESKTEKSKHNSQGEFFVEYISGDLETLDPNTLNEIAAIQSNSPHLGEVTPHFDFTLELTKDEKLDNDKLLKKLESLKNIYCKEKQDLMSKCENLTIQLENESLSRRQLEQELINISEDFGETITKPETEVSINSQGENNAKLPPKKTLTAKNTLKKESVPKPCHFESMIKSLECELHEKEDSLKQQNIEVGMGEALQEQRLNEMKVLFKSELRKLEVENSSLLEQKYQLENQNLELNKQSESKASRGGNSKSCISVESQTNELELINEKHLQKKQQLIEQLEAHNSKLESDSELLFVKEKEKEMTIKELTEKCQNLEMEAQEKVQLVEQLDQQCASYKLKLQTTGHDSSEMKQVGSFIELQEKCKNLELELERAKQNETFACVYEEKCKQLESDLENQQDYKQDLMEMTEKFERLEKEYKEQNVNHLQELNSCTSVIEKLRQKCENIDSLVANERKLSQETSVQCEHYQKELTVKQTLLKELEEKSSKNDIQLEELSNKCANLTDSLQIQKHKNNRLKKENVENCKKYEAEISHKERALDEINDTCSKFEIAEYENEHVIQELTTQCQKYQSEIQALRAKELLKMKKTLSCSVDEIESTDYHEFIVDSSTCVFDDEEEKIPDEKRENKSESEFDNKVKEDILVQERASYVETGINDMSGTYGRVTELETLLKDKDALIRKYETELDQRNDELDRMDDLRQYQEHLEMSVREKDSYIKQLEEHFLQQRTPVSIRSTVKPCKLGNVGQHRNDEPAGITCSTPTMNMPENIHSSEMELQDNLSDQSTISGENSFTKQKSQDSLLSDKTDNDGNFVTHSKFNDSLLSDSKNHNTQTLSALSESGSGRSDEASYSQMDMKHFAIVEEISKLRQDLRETKSVYTQENALLREALDKEKWNRDSKLESQNVEQHFSSEVGNLQQKVSLLKETNDMLRKENDEWLKRVQEQETIVLQLREQLGCDVNKDENKCDQSFNQQLKLLQQQRNELVERLGDSENKIGSLAQSLSEKSISEENLRCEKAKLQTKLYEMEEVEKELTEKKIELEKQKATQSRLEEVIYHRDLIERELMKQKRLLEVELAEIECKLHEKEELLEIQKNQLLEEIKQNYSSDRISDTSKLLSSSLESSDFSFEGARSKPASRTSQPHTSSYSGTKSKTTKPWSQYRQQGNVNRLELMLSDVEKEHAEAISYLKEKLHPSEQSQAISDSRQGYTPKKL